MLCGKVGVLVLAGSLVFGSVHVPAQQLRETTPGPSGSAEGTLSVTATIASSVGVVIEADGKPRIILANAADPRDNMAWFATVNCPGGCDKSKAESNPRESAKNEAGR